MFLSVFFLLLVGVADLSFYIIAAMAVQEAASEGASYGASPNNQNDNSGMVLWASQAAYGVALSGSPTSQTFFTCSPGGTHVSSSTLCPDNTAPMEYVTVTATTNQNPFFRNSFLSGGTITGTATFRVAWKTQ